MIIDQSNYRLILRWDGEITWFVKKTMKTSCPIDVTYFPYDTQTCPIKLGSWTLDNTVFAFDISPWNDSISEGAFFVYSEKSFIPHSAWHVRSTTAEVSEDFDFPEVTLYLKMKRKSLYFAINLILPTAVLAFISPLTFLLPAESGERSGLAITLLLSMVVFMLLVADVTPQSSESVSIVEVFLTSVSKRK